MRLRALLSTLLATLAFAPALLAQGTLTPRDLWPQATAASDAGNAAERDQRVTELIQAGRSYGIRRFPLYAESAAALAVQANRQKNDAASQWALSTARRLDPESASVEFAAADLARMKGNWMGAAAALLSGLRKTLGDYRTGILARNDLLVTAATAVAIAVCIFALILFLQYARRAIHDFREVLGSRLPQSIATVIAGALLILPIFLWLGPLWLVLYWLCLLFGYASLKERIATAVALVLLALVPLLLDSAAYRMAVVDSPVVRAASASMFRAYDPDAAQRVRDMIELVPTDARLHLLLGNLLVQQGNEQEAGVHFRKALELDPNLAGAHLNLGNLHFVVNDLQAASLEYAKASEADASLAIADYNASVASGEQYKFDEQGQLLEKAKQKDRPLIEHILASPPAQKVVMYHLPLEDAWSMSAALADRRETRDLYGNFAQFDPARSLANPLTIGSILALVGGFALWSMRRRTGFAGECIKCGRTFCYRCKSTHESSTYCTQCIHIYLKRDGVSLDTKRAKLEEVQRYQGRSSRRRKLLTTVLPGAAQIVDGNTIRGVIALGLFVFFVALAVYTGRLAPIGTPAVTMKDALRGGAIALAVLTWALASIPVYRERSAG